MSLIFCTWINFLFITADEWREALRATYNKTKKKPLTRRCFQIKDWVVLRELCRTCSHIFPHQTPLKSSQTCVTSVSSWSQDSLALVSIFTKLFLTDWKSRSSGWSLLITLITVSNWSKYWRFWCFLPLCFFSNQILYFLRCFYAWMYLFWFW